MQLKISIFIMWYAQSVIVTASLIVALETFTEHAHGMVVMTLRMPSSLKE